MAPERQALVIVGVDGSASSVEALRQAQHVAVGLDARIEATACWDYPPMPERYEVMGIEGFEERVEHTVAAALKEAYGPELPENVTVRLRQGSARPTLIEASKEADMLIVGRRGRGGFVGLLLGSVSSACIARAFCPVLVVRGPALADTEVPD